VRVAPGRALTNAEAILTAAVAWRPTLMVGPLPISDIAVDRRIRHLSDDLAFLCARLRVPYLDVFDLVAASDIWAREILAGDGVHPNEGGYAMIGDAVENWAGWRAWIDRAASSSADGRENA
jgi:acyl-CoA thioesterase I